MNNPLIILQTLDRHLDRPVELTLYGRAALALGFPSHESCHKTTLVVRLHHTMAFENVDLWKSAAFAANPEGIESFSPRLRRRSYLGCRIGMPVNPNGVASVSSHGDIGTTNVIGIHCHPRVVLSLTSTTDGCVLWNRHAQRACQEA